MKMPFLIMLVGVPAAGKSTFITELTRHFKFNVLSSDNHIEAHAKANNTSYDNVFKEQIKIAHAKLNIDCGFFVNMKLNVVWDQTNLNANKRRGLLGQFKNYTKIAIFFPTPDPKEHQRRLESRPGKTIPQWVIDDMKTRVEIPNVSEDFDFTFVNNSGIIDELKRII